VGILADYSASMPSGKRALKVEIYALDSVMFNSISKSSSGMGEGQQNPRP